MSSVAILLATAVTVCAGSADQPRPDSPAARARNAAETRNAQLDAEWRRLAEQMGSVGDANLVVVDGSLSTRGGELSTAVFGEIRNEGSLPARLIRVDLVAFDGADALVDTAWTFSYGSPCTTTDGQSQIECIPAGEVGWFIALMDAAVEEIDHFEHAVSGIESDLVPAEPPVALEGAVDVTEQGLGTLLRGTLRNTGDADLVLVSVTAALRDGDGAIIDITRGWVDGDRIGGYINGIRAGQTAGFEVFAPSPLADHASHELRYGWTGYRGGSFRYAVAGVAHSPGIDDAVWRSSLAVANSSGADGEVTVTFHRAAGLSTAEVLLPDGGMKIWDDVVSSLFELDADTAGLVRVDSDVPLTVTARTYNDTSSGSFGQLLPTLTPGTTLYGHDRGQLAPVRGGDGFRTNIGLVNLSEDACGLAIRLFTTDGSMVADLGEVEVGGRSWRQLNDVAPQEMEAGYAMVEVLGSCSAWAYASVIDRATGDPTMVPVEREVNIGAVGAVRAGGGWW